MLGGRRLIDYPLAAMRAAGLPVLVVAKADNDVGGLIGDAPGVTAVAEPDEPRHPLRGIVTALEQAGGPIVVCACDMPCVTPKLLAALAALTDDLAVVELDGVPQPMLGRYSPAKLGQLRDALAAELSVRESLRRAGARLLPTAWLAQFGDPDVLTFDVDTPDDLARAESLLPQSP